MMVERGCGHDFPSAREQFRGASVAHWGRAGGYLRRGPNLHTMDGGGDQCADLTASVGLTVFERCDRRHRSAVRQRFIFWTTHWERGRKAEKGRELPGGNYRCGHA